MDEKTVYIIIGCDSDQDRPQYGGTRLDVKELNWSGLEYTLENTEEVFGGIKDKKGNHAKVTWYIRSDQQIRKIYNSSSWCIKHFGSYCNDLKSRGDEIGWHPHLTRWSEIKNCWYQEIIDQKWIENCLREGYASLVKELGVPVKSAKAGYYFHNNSTMKVFNDLGIRIDLSATPGLKSEGSSDERGSFFINEYDWKITPDFPYFPSEEDYRRPARGNENSLDLLECPNSTYSKSTKRIVLALSPFKPRSEKKLTLPSINRDKKPLFITMDPEYFNVTLKRKFKAAKSKGTSYLITYFHPDELLATNDFFSIENLKKNLKSIYLFSKKFNVTFEFLTAIEFHNRFSRVFS